MRGPVAFLSGLAVVVAGFVTAASGCSKDYESRTIPPEEGGPARETGADGADPVATCPTTGPIDGAKLRWKPPTPPQVGKCQTDDIDAMNEFLRAEPQATNEDFENFVKNRDATCHDCVFGDANGGTWPPAPVQDGKVVTFNIGACYALVTGLQQCGRAVQNAWDCEFEACASCTSADELDTCRAKSRTGACKAFVDLSRTECIGAPSADGVCGLPFDSVRVQCITTVKPIVDAGPG